MNSIPRLFLLPLLVALAALALPARGQYFFPNGWDYVSYVPHVRGASGRLYVADQYKDNEACHYRLDLPPGKTVQKVELRPLFRFPQVAVTRLGGEIEFYGGNDFTRVNAQGQPCANAARALGSAPWARESDAPVSIPVSNSADSFNITCDGRFAVVVGNGPAPTFAGPVSLVDLSAGREVDTLNFTGRGNFVATCDDGESVLVLINDPGNMNNSVRRLKIVNGKLVDTGERLDPPGTESARFFRKVYAAPGSKVGVALGFYAPQLTTFSIPGLQVLDTSPETRDAESSAAVSCAGDKIYLRINSFAGGIPRGHIQGFTLDPATGAIGDTPFLTTDVAYTQQASTTFGDGLAISRDGTLIVPESTIGPTAPPTARTSFLDATTGARLGFFDAFGEGADFPTLVATYPCCSVAGLRLSIERLTTGLIQITAIGEIGKKYELEKSQNLVAWDKLLEFQMTVSPTPYTDLDSEAGSTRFYRLRLVP